MKKKSACLLFVALLFPAGFAPLSGQTVEIDGEIRSRMEYREGFRQPLADTLAGSTIASLRTRLRLNYDAGKTKARITLQDARIYGQTGTNDTRNSLGLFEAWGSYLLTSDFSATLGRQAIEYDDKRLLTVSNWSQTGSAHDMLLMKYEPANRFKLHWGGAWNHSGDDAYEQPYNVARSYKALTFVWFGKSFEPGDFSAIWLNDVFNYSPTDTETGKKSFRHTLGGNLRLKKDGIPFSLYTTAYYQFGHDPANAPLDACLLAANAQYRCSEAWSIKTGIDYFSGSTPEERQKGKNKTFNKLYGSNNSFNGMMEYWTTLPEQGLLELYGVITCQSGRVFDINVAFRSFALTESLAETKQRGIGSEIDLTLHYTLWSDLTLQGGWSVYFRNRQTDLLKAQTGLHTHFPQWGYVMVTFKPQFLK
ncbi:MAG: alginate export family protein [Tannerellaceae bacterium]|nr:alginate export family protein [Tannerellaceae bacterium]